MPEPTRGILLDTSVVVAHLRGRLDLFTLAQPEEARFLPLAALGELYKGAEKSNQSRHGHQLVDALLAKIVLLLPDVDTAHHYARIAAHLERTGQSIPENDLWIAATALKYDLPLATRDAHFERVPGLTVLRW